MINYFLIRFLIWISFYALMPQKDSGHKYSSLLYSAENELLGARIAPDGQWRFPPSDSLSIKFTDCATTYEDKFFFYHPGIDATAVLRAIYLNIKHQRIISGGSTITMQLARILRGNRERTFYEKIVEAIFAISLESHYSKQELLGMYASNAPFGGNVVGLETASWRYFGRSSASLSWAENATLAVLPNSPALIHPGRSRDKLKKKRNRLLKMLHDRGYFDLTTYELSCAEPLPEAPIQLPDDAPHMLERLAASKPGTAIHSSVIRSLQQQTQSIVNRYALEYMDNHINNIAALIADVETGEVLAYSGNVNFNDRSKHGSQVDVITSRRSTGSIMKPFLYAAMLSDGMLLPNMLISDTPLNINGFTPQNYNHSFSGVVPAHRALEQSLNVPLVRMLSSYNTGRFMSILKKLGMTTLNFSEEHYGASLILGGAEGTLWDFCGMYASMARVLNHYTIYNSRYDNTDIHPLTPFIVGKHKLNKPEEKNITTKPLLSASSIWFTFEAMSALNRPEEEADWQQFGSMKQVAWKTGTSYGGRDAWAIGTTPKYVVGVWCGNASGEGRSGLTGVGTAAPILFDIYSLLSDGDWFEKPYDDMEEKVICRQSGHLASSICEPTDTMLVPKVNNKTIVCPYHQLVNLSTDLKYRVNTSCETIDNIVNRPWFVLRPSQEYYYRRINIDYKPLPPYRSGCTPIHNREIEFIYPEHRSILYLPKGLSGERQKFVFRAAHARTEATLFWYIDNTYIGETTDNHQIECQPSSGIHYLTLTDEEGNQRKIMFEVK